MIVELRTRCGCTRRLDVPYDQLGATFTVALPPPRRVWTEPASKFVPFQDRVFDLYAEERHPFDGRITYYLERE